MENMIDASHIIRVCKGRQRTAGGYQWRYVDIELSVEVNHKRKVVQYDLNNNLIREYDSISQAASQTGISIASICTTCRGGQKTAGGYKWKYFEPI